MGNAQYPRLRKYQDIRLLGGDCHFKDIIFAGLSSGEKRAGGAQDGWRYGINFILAH
jgi:hypothetical protein